MNWLLIACLAIVIICIILGYRNGFLRVLLSLLSWVLVLVASYFLTPVVANVILEKTPLVAVVHETVNDKLNEAVERLMEETTANQAFLQVEEQLPAQLKDMILGEGSGLAEFLNATGEIEVHTMPLSNAAAHIIGFVLVLLLVKLLLFIIEKIINWIEELPVLGTFNKVLGVLAGMIQGIVWCWALLVLVTFLAYVGVTDELLRMVNESKVLSWLYEINPMMDILTII